MTPSPENTAARHERSALTTLVLLQELDLMIRDATDREQAEEVSKMGFKVGTLTNMETIQKEQKIPRLRMIGIVAIEMSRTPSPSVTIDKVAGVTSSP